MGKQIERRSWGYFMNLAFQCAHGKYLLMISDDCLLVPDAVMNGYNLFEKKLSDEENIGAVAFYWRNWPDQKDYWVGLTLGSKMFVNHGMFLRKALEEVGWLDEETCSFYHADGDVGLKLWKAGYEIVPCPTSFVEHCNHANVTVRRSNMERQKIDWKNYLAKWEGIFYDPEKNDTGAWIYLQYDDSYKTGDAFRKLTRNTRIKIKIFNVFNKVRNYFEKSSK